MNHDIPWKRFSVEAVVIVGSILLAFGIDAYWTELTERDQELRTLENLEREFALNSGRISGFVEIQGVSEKTALQLLGRWSEIEPSPELERLIVITLLNKNLLNLSRGALESYLTSGEPELIRNQELRNQLFQWHSIVDNYAEDEEIDALYVENTLKPYLIENTDYGRLLDVHPFASSLFSALPDSPLDTSGLMRILNDPIGKNHVARRFSYKNLLRREAETLRKQSEEILEMIRSELNVTR